MVPAARNRTCGPTAVVSKGGDLAAMVLKAIKPDGLLVSGVRLKFKDVEPERMDAVILGLVRCGDARMRNGRLEPARMRLRMTCKKCGELQSWDNLLDSKVCLPCASNAAAADFGDATKQCPCCKAYVYMRVYGHGVYCKPCQRGKARKYKAAKLARLAAAAEATV